MSCSTVNRIKSARKWLAPLVLACLVIGRAAEARAQGGVIQVAPVPKGGALLKNGFATPAATPAPQTPAVGDVVRFLDGSELHGELRSIAPGQEVRWMHPGAKKDIEFLSTNIGSIHFANAVRGTNAGTAFKPSCQVCLSGGDVFFGALTAMDEEQLTLNTAFAGETKIPRASVQSISFLPPEFSIVYDGPLLAKEWQISPAGSWSFRDGVFMSSGSGALTSDFDVPGSLTLEFDLEWSSTFYLIASLYSGQRQDSEGFNSYLVTLSSTSVDVKRQSPTTMASLGKADLPGLAQKGRGHFTIQCNRTEGTLAVFVDHQLVKRWKDTRHDRTQRSSPQQYSADVLARC